MFPILDGNLFCHMKILSKVCLALSLYTVLCIIRSILPVSTHSLIGTPCFLLLDINTGVKCINIDTIELS